MYCSQCGAASAPVDRFCGSCGVLLLRLSPDQQAWVASGALPHAPRHERTPSVATPLSVLVPWRDWQERGLWRQGPLLLVLVAALAPFLLLHLGDDPERFRQVSWGFSAYFALLWFLVLRLFVAPGGVPWQLLVRIAVFTLVVGVAVAIGLERAVGADTSNPLRSTLEVGVPEELAKALAVWVFCSRARTLRPVQVFLFAGVVSGLAFGASEAVTYSTAYAHLLAETVDVRPLLVAEIWRLVTDSLFHACMAGIAALFIGLAAHHRGARWRLTGFGIGAAAVLHGFYDTYAQGWAGLVMAGVIVMAFCGYVVSAGRIDARLSGAVVRPAGTPAPAVA